MTRSPQAGLTLVEVVLGTLTLAIVVAAILGAYIGQLTLNEHGRNVSLASNDASRVLEQIRRENVAGCAQPKAVPTPPAVDWDGWLSTESIALNPATGTYDDAQELIVVTCLRSGVSGVPVLADYCEDDNAAGGDPGQVGSGEWTGNAADTAFNPLQITVAVCWRHRNRVIGECRWTGAALEALDGAQGNPVDGLISSPVMLTTFVACDGP